MTILSVLATISGSVMALAALPQIYKIFKRKSAKDISAISYFLFTVGGIMQCRRNNLVIIWYRIK